MKVMLIDDEQLAIDMLEVLLSNMNGIEIVGKFTNPHIALESLQELEVDIIFLDMEMGNLHGLEFAEQLTINKPHIDIVFVTAHPQFALEAFEVNVIDYLLKPIDQKRLAKTMDKLQRRLIKQLPVSQKKESVLFAQVMGSFHLLDKEENEVKWRTKKVKELFILLWHHKQTGIHRSQIIMELWPELPEDKAVALMHTTIYQLRKMIRKMGFSKPVMLRNEQYILAIPLKSDFDELKTILTSAHINESLIKESIKLYQGDYLEVEDYQWSLATREMVRRLFLSYLERYISLEKSMGKSSDLIEVCLQRMIQLDPYKIQYTYWLLEYYKETGDTEKVVFVFQEAKEKWIGELGLNMPQEIIDIYDKYISQ